MFNEAMAKKTEADKLVSQGFFSSSPFFRSFQSTSSIQHSINSLQRALSLYQEIDVRSSFPQESRRGEADALHNLHFPYQRLGQHQEAISYLQQAISIYQEVQYQEGEAKSLEELGLIYSDLQQDQQAIECLNQAVDRYRIFDTSQECNILNTLGAICSRAGQLEAAVQSYKQALKVAQQLGAIDVQLMPLRNLASIYSQQGDYLQARTYCEQALILARQTRDPLQEAKTLHALGDLHCEHNQTQLGIDCLQQALVAFRRSDGEHLTIFVSGGEHLSMLVLAALGKAYSSLEQYSQAIETFQQAIAIAQETGNHEAELNCSHQLAEVYLAAVQYSEAIAIYQRLLSFARMQGDGQLEGVMLLSLGKSYSGLNQAAQAYNYYQEALPILQSVGERRGEANCWYNLGIYYASLEQYSRVLETFQLALEIYRDLGDRAYQIRCLKDIAATYFSLEQPQNAIVPIQQELVLIREVGDQKAEIDALTRLGMACFCTEQFRHALQLLKQALEICQIMGYRDSVFMLRELIDTLSQAQQESPKSKQ